ncbi:helix-turn-helix domain-containing protein [Pleionea litopenaei]|uniref:Helix-turn-helix domain-containing protein n=1 Tax=Pleionea litopenaei TaxID=3070815 RepID=A0AA51X991_9GAMM|nr:helix-turn-helix domain-containing protein [Pleionea sp. HL-JVS1]WMS88930.1 helix-turn-helix domain-containing protein [Pleionea sp. HL-JVS1]
MNSTFLGVIYFVGFSHALMLSLVLWRKSSAGSAGRLLAIIGLVIGYKLFEGAALFTGLFRWVPHAMDLLPGEVLVLGPLILAYVSKVTSASYFNHKYWPAHFLPAAALWLFNSPAVFTSGSNKIQMWENVLNASHNTYAPLFIFVLLLSIKAHLATYLWLSWRQINQFSIASRTLRADQSQQLLQQQRFIVIAFFVLEAIWVLLFLAQQFAQIGALGVVSDIWLLLVASMVLALGYIGLQQPDLVFSNEERKLTEQISASNKAQSDEKESSNVKYFHSSLPDSAALALSKELEDAIREQQLFLNEKLTLTDLAKATGIKAHTLSQVISQVMQSNFYKLINGFRIQYAVELIEQIDLQWSMERIAYESGFNNRVTFSKAFKEFMACTPSAYKKKFLEEGSKSNDQQQSN